jgi:hypothetical protein
MKEKELPDFSLSYADRRTPYSELFSFNSERRTPYSELYEPPADIGHSSYSHLDIIFPLLILNSKGNRI